MWKGDEMESRENSCKNYSSLKESVEVFDVGYRMVVECICVELKRVFFKIGFYLVFWLVYLELNVMEDG